MKTPIGRAVMLSIASIASVNVSAQPAGTPWALQPHGIDSPAGADSAQPQLTVSNRGVLLSWIERKAETAVLMFSERTSAGWSVPRVVASGNNWFLNWADVPSVLRLGDGTLAAHWLQKNAVSTYAYDVRLSYSADDGKTWASSVLPHHDGTPTEHGFVSLFPMPRSGLGLIWLDGRAMTGGHDGHGDMSLRFGAFDRQWKQTVELAVDQRVCECCPTAAAVTSDGPIVAYRNRDQDETRDIHISRFENGRWTESYAAHADDWKINACPVNGPMLSARQRNVVLSWFTARNNQSQAYAAFSSDAGRTFGTPVRLDDGSTGGRVDVELLPDGSAAASYIGYADQRAFFNVRRVDRTGGRSTAVTIAEIEYGRNSGYPRMALHGDELVFAWIERTGTSQVKTAVAKLPR